MRCEDEQSAEAKSGEVVVKKEKIGNGNIFDFDVNKSDGISNDSHSLPSFMDDTSDMNSEIVLRPHDGFEKKRVISAVIVPSKGYFTPKRIHSTSDLQSLQGASNGFLESNKKNYTVPRGNSNGINGNLSTFSTGDIADNNNLEEKNNYHLKNRLSPLVCPVWNGGNVNKAFSICDSTDYSPRSPGMFSVIATPHPPDNPTSTINKKRAFSDLLVKSLSLMYAVFNVTVGLAVFIADIISDTPQITAEIFSLILVVIAAIYIIYLTIDVSIYLHKKERYERLLEKNIPDDIELTETPEGFYQFNITLPEVTKLGQSIKHDYCFNKDRHSSNFFLKVGATAFCMGHLIHSGLILGYQFVFLSAGNNRFYECASAPTLILDFIYPLYSFLLLFFIYKYSNVIINRNAVLARFGIMHCLSSSICFWIWTICREVLEAIASKKYDTYADSVIATEVPDIDLETDSVHISPRRFTQICDNEKGSMKTIYKDISPYLYPFSVEFSILVVGVLYLVWQNIAICEAADEDEAATTQCKKTLSNDVDSTESNVAIHADCQASNKGLFGGIVVLVLVFVACILFFMVYYMDDENDAELGITATLSTSIFVLSAMIIACIFGYRQITKLDLNSAHHNLLDDVLLFICMPAFFLNGVFSLIASIEYSNVIGILNIVVEIIQVLIQTIFLLDGMRRSSNTRKLRKKKPGRELVTFLIISNIALWLMQTFEVKAHGIQDNRYSFYGKEMWTILGHLCLPLMMFYRFHSSVCFGDIWKYAYEPSGH
ncbi:unnamed protein product [Phaedon cochleariae]|uniref:Proton channel OtopLc-like n=1 Tax=Phaedon cochleariae TaxID=80249 RepID=A0A9P0DTF9_PHACE|nr:unnamed protein product [Phaedon cochleariae]